MRKIFFLTCMFLVTLSFAKKWDATYISKLIASGGIDKVIQYYQQRYYGDNRDPQDAFRIAELYIKKKDYATAMQWYDKESQLIYSSKINLYNYAYANQLMGNYQKALDAYLMYAAQTGDVKKVMDLANQCEKILKASSQTSSYKLENYSFNTSADETNIAVLRTNPVYVISNRNEENINNEILQIVREYDNFLEPVKAYKNGVPKLIITSLSYTQDGNSLVFSAIEPSSKKHKNEKIYFAENLGANFLNVRPFSFNADGSSCKNPVFNTNGTTLYFSSNQIGGLGGFDIWESKLENNKWTKPVNLGKLLNTKSDEINPFVVQDGQDHTLYFSSDREGGFGGFDIYKANNKTGIWQDAEMQPAPVNSAGNDISIIYDDEVKTGYFSSDRNGGKGGFDIYRFIPFNLKLVVNAYDSLTEKKLDYALVQVFEKGNKVYEGVTNENGTAEFQVDKNKSFTIKLSKDNYRPIISNISSTSKMSGDSVVADVYLKQDEQFAIKNSTTNNLSLDNFIIFTGYVTDGTTNKPAKHAKMRMVNYATQKLREVDIDSSGKFELKLLLNNNYKVIFENHENKITDELTTLGMDRNNVKVRNYTLNGSKFKLTENKVYEAGSLPSNINIKTDNNVKNSLPGSANNFITNQPITQSKIDSLKKVISKDNPQYAKINNTTKPKVSVPAPVAIQNTEKVIKETKAVKQDIQTSIKDTKIVKQNIQTPSKEIKAVKQDTQTVTKEIKVIKQDIPKVIEEPKVVKQDIPKITEEPKKIEKQTIVVGKKEEEIIKTAKESTVATAVISEAKVKLPAEKPLEQKAEVKADEVKETKAVKPVVLTDEDEPQLAADMVSTKKSKKVKNIPVEKGEIITEIPTEKKPAQPQAENINIVKKPEPVVETKSVKIAEPIKEVIKEEIKITEPAPVQKTITTNEPSLAVVKTNNTTLPKKETPKVSTKQIAEEKKAPLAAVVEDLPDLYYKVQLASYDKGNIKFPELEHLGKIEEVKAYEQYIYRLGNYENLKRAKEVLELVRSQGYFVAFILQYNKDKVTGIVN